MALAGRRCNFSSAASSVGSGQWLPGSSGRHSHYVYLICGVAAVITENLVIGFFNMSQQFAQNPKDILTWFIQTVLPKPRSVQGSRLCSGSANDP
jgi:hypothetical protein